jgi:hypothetical protein
MDMGDLETCFMKLARNQQGSMAFERIFFRAHQSDAVLLYSLGDTIYSFGKLRLSCQSVILDFALFVTVRVFTPSAQLPAQEDICNTHPCQSSFQRVAAILRGKAAIRMRAYVADGSNAMSSKKRSECIYWVIRMADGEKHGSDRCLADEFQLPPDFVGNQRDGIG